MIAATGRAARRAPRSLHRSALAVLTALAGCSAAAPGSRATASDTPQERLLRARRLADQGPADAILQARAGWLEHLISSSPEAARLRFERALANPAAAPGSAEASARALALAGLGELAEDRLDIRAAAGAFLAALAAAPRAPIGELAAQRLLDLEGDSPAVDDLVLEAAAAAGPGTSPRSARLLREAAARVAGSRAFAGSDERAAWAAAGAVQRYRIAGPFAPLRLQALGEALALDKPERTRAPASGPAGSTAERALDFPDGDVGLELEPADGDVFFAASDLTAARGGDYLLWIEGAAALELRLDGAPLIVRTPWPREVPRAQTLPVRLAAGPHALLVRWSRAEGSRFRLVIARADGDRGDLSSAAPAELWGQRLGSGCPLASNCAAAPAWPDDRGLRGEAERALARDPGDPLAAYLLARATASDDKAAARSAAEVAVVLSGNGAPALVLRAGVTLRDPEVPDRIGRARALADLREALTKAPGLLRARLTAAAQQRDSERTDDAAAELDRANETAQQLAGPGRPLPPRLLLARSRLLDAQGNSLGARAAAQAAAAQDEGGPRCDATSALLEFARREGSLAEQRRLAEQSLGCVDQRSSLFSLLRERGELAAAEALLTKNAALRPASPQRLEQVAEVQAARRQLDAAVETLRAAALLSPRSPEPLRRLASWLDAKGDPQGAEEARVEALRRQPGDLQLRRQLAFLRGESLLAWSDRDVAPLAKTGGDLGLPAGSAVPAAVRLLDHGAIELFEGGAAVERVHTLTRVLDKKGIARFGEVQIPDGSEILQLRTLKPDGRALEPESIPEKEGYSLPGLEPGDAIEIDYLRAIAPRGPELPGLTLGAFLFHDDETPMAESTYDLRAAPGVKVELDVQNLQIKPPESRPDGTRFSHTARAVVPEPPEPSQTSDTESAPWVQVGFGAGQRELVRSLADWALLRARPGGATDALARSAGGGTPAEKTGRIVAAIAQLVRGRSAGNDFSAPAPHVLAQGRGNRLLLAKAALASAGVKSHLALVRPFGAPPQALRFPRNDVFTYAVLRVDPDQGEIPGAPAIWVDTSWRLGPVGVLPLFVRGQPAWLLPEPGEEALLVTTPAFEGASDGRLLSLDLALEASGMAAGTGRDEQRGFEAAAMREALEKMDGEQRRQGVEGMLGRSLRGVSLEKLTIEGENAQGGPASLLYTVRARIGRRDGDLLRVPASLLPARLSRRWVQKAERTRTLLIDASERTAAEVTLALPKGMHLQNVPAKVSLQTRFGSFSWEAHEEAGRLSITESLVLPPQRVTVAEYPAFAAFARAVDQAEEQELALAATGAVTAALP